MAQRNQGGDRKSEDIRGAIRTHGVGDKKLGTQILS
jgi:hypothetical protein